MDVVQDGARTAASLADWLAPLTFTGLATDEVTAWIIDTVAAWAGAQGWRVYRRAPSVVPLPPPLSRQYSVLDVACARPDGPPVAVEVDRSDRRRTYDKLVAEAGAGRIALWVRWGPGPFIAAAPPVHLVPCEVTRRSGPAGQGRLHDRLRVPERPAPAHSQQGTGVADEVALPIAFTDSPPPSGPHSAPG